MSTATQNLSRADLSDADLARERRRSGDAVLLARLAEQAARESERELAATTVRLHEAEREISRLSEALAAERGSASAAVDPAGEREALRSERDAAVQRVQELQSEHGLDRFAVWLLQRRVALGLLRRSRAGAMAAVVHGARASGAHPAISDASLHRLAGRRAVLALQGRRLISGLPAAIEAVRFRLRSPV